MNLQALIQLLQTTYCERSGPGLYDEPLNTISNLAFIIAAVLAAHQARVFRVSPAAKLLPWSLALVGMGSVMYHTFRNPLTFVLDVLLLGGFMLSPIYLVARKCMEKPGEAAVAVTAFASIQALLLICVPNDVLNGSAPHIFTLILAPLFIGLVARRFRHLLWKLAPITAWYTLAIVFRTFDLVLCPWLPIGTHFLWHVAAAGTGYLVVRFVFISEEAGQHRFAAMAV